MKLLYRGLSLLDPTAEIMVASTSDSDNRKTGPMEQLWIMRTDRHPMVALRDGSDFAICGNCPLRPGPSGRVCYVSVQHAPAAIYRAFKAGRYRNVANRPAPHASHTLKGLNVRIGAYGDPAAIPVEWWRTILRRAAGWTAYTHHWRTCSPEMREIAMASVDNEGEAAEARAAGYRTYRVRTTDSAVRADEARCPASDEMGHRTTCVKCLLCNGRELGDTRQHITILAHAAPLAFYRSRQIGLFE